MNARPLAAFVILAAVCFGACSGGSKRGGFADSSAADPNQPGGGFGGAADAGQPNPCAINQTATDKDKDYDGDGYALKDDCNECDPNVNAGAYDYPGNGIDEDCDGVPDNDAAGCDNALDIAGDAYAGAAAIGLCKRATNDRMWGVLEAKWVKPDGSPQTEPLGEGILAHYGVNNPQAGAAMVAISSGSARAPGDPGYQDVSGWSKGYESGTPAGYPKTPPSCSGGIFDLFGSSSNDGAALQVTIRVPSNAKSFSYQQNFFTYEFPMFICSEFNDFFVTMMDPKPAGLPDGNIAFDQDGNPISVNNSMLRVCQPQSAGFKNFACPLGDASLANTGYEGHAATGWLTTTTPVDTLRGKEITLLWAIWDQGDGALDSTALIDDFQWSVQPASGAQTLPTPPK